MSESNESYDTKGVGQSSLEGPTFLLNQVAGQRDRQRAMAVLLVSAIVFCLLAPFAKVQLAAVPAFIPAYEATLLITDLITAVLLFGQYRILRVSKLLPLACGYVFTALMTAAHALSFPALFAPGGLLGAGAQTTAWIYMFWHAGFPLFVLAYVALDRRPTNAAMRGAVWAWTALAVALAGILTLLATAGQSLLPPIMAGNHYTPSMRIVVGAVWLVSLLAAFALWKSKPHSVLDLWIMVVLSAWLFDIALSAVLNAGRFDLGFYAGRLYGLIATSVVLLEMLLENGVLYARLVDLHAQEQHKNAELEVARDEARAADKAKGLFLASMSHEIRTPMNAIIGLTHIVLQGRLDHRQRDHLLKVQTSSKALLTLLNDILDYSKVEAGKLTLEAETFNPEDLVENVGNLFAAKVEESGLDMVYDIGEGIPTHLLGDPMRLGQVLNNLVGNAVKFTPKGEIVVGVTAGPVTDNAVELYFSVRDTGIGMTADQVNRLFEVFTQADATITRRYGGSGLGLAISKRLVELMGGTMRVHSEQGQGSMFGFSAKFQLAAPGNAHVDPHRIRGMRTLVVDGQPTARLVLQQTLQSWHCQVSTASFLDDALRKLRRAAEVAPFELLLLDWKTAQIDLLEPFLDGGGDTRIAVVMAGVQALEQVSEATADRPTVAVLAKPVTPSRLFDAIVRLQHGGATQAVPTHRTADAFAELAPIRGAHVLLAEDNPVNQQVAAAFLDLGGLSVTIANDGLEAVDWVKKQDFDAVLMDMQMPDLDGIQATRAIRQLPSGMRVPIIAMTAAAMDEDVQACLAAGMNAHVSKPIEPRQLVRALLTWIPERETADAERAIR